MRVAVLVILLSSLAYAGGPKYGYSDPKLNDEMDNIYHDIRSVNAGGIRGTTTDDDAQPGRIGEHYRSRVNVVDAPTTGEWGDATFISLTAGDWDVSLMGSLYNNSATITRAIIGVGTISGNNGPNITGEYPDDQADIAFNSGGTATSAIGAIPGLRVSLASSANVYFKMYCLYSSGTPQFRGRISARRVR